MVLSHLPRDLRPVVYSALTPLGTASPSVKWVQPCSGFSLRVCCSDMRLYMQSGVWLLSPTASWCMKWQA